MKKILFALILALQGLFCAQANAAPCTMSTLGAYVTLGTAGCEIGSFRFSHFALLPQIANSIPFTTLNVTPVSGAGVIGLDFTVNATAGPGVFFDNLISYRITGLGATVNGASLFITGSSATGNGAVTAAEDLCLGGVFSNPDGVSGCTGSAANLIVFNIPPISDLVESLGPFAAVSALAVVTDIGVDSGGDGTASLVSASNRFQVAVAAVPEPASLLLMAAGLLALYGYRGARRLQVSRRA